MLVSTAVREVAAGWGRGEMGRNYWRSSAHHCKSVECMEPGRTRANTAPTQAACMAAHAMLRPIREATGQHQKCAVNNCCK